MQSLVQVNIRGPKYTEVRPLLAIPSLWVVLILKNTHELLFLLSQVGFLRVLLQILHFGLFGSSFHILSVILWPPHYFSLTHSSLRGVLSHYTSFPEVASCIF